MQPKRDPSEHFDSPKSENGEFSDIHGIKDRIQFYENKRVSFKLPEEDETKTPNKIEEIKKKLLKRVYGEEEDIILSGDYCELTDSDESNANCPSKGGVPDVNEKTSPAENTVLKFNEEKTGKDITEKLDSKENKGKSSISEAKNSIQACKCQESNTHPQILKTADISGENLNDQCEYGSKIKYAFMLSQEMKQGSNKEIDAVFSALDNLCKDKEGGMSKGSLSSVKEIFNQHPEIALEDYSDKLTETSQASASNSNLQNQEAYDLESTCCSIQGENLDEELRNISIREMIKNVENEINRERVTPSESLESENLLCTGIDMHKGLLPTTQEFLDDYSLFSSRPSFLNVSQTVNPTFNSISTRNLYNGKNLIFSKSDIHSKEFKFRAPGAPLPTRPTITPLSSILTETSVLHYIKVSVKNSDTSWFVLKELNNSDKLIPYHSDEDLNRFILTDIVTEIFKRSNFLIYDHRVVTGKFIGKTLCLCKDTACLKSLSCSSVEKIARTKMLIDGVELEVSCETERNEWVDAIIRVSCC